MIVSLGPLRVTQPGSPQRVTVNLQKPLERYAVHGVLLQVLPTNAGKIYVGNSELNRATFVGLYGMLAIPTANVLPTFSAALTLSPNAINLTDMFIDADQNNDGVIVSVLVT